MPQEVASVVQNSCSSELFRRIYCEAALLRRAREPPEAALAVATKSASEALNRLPLLVSPLSKQMDLRALEHADA